MSLGLRAEANNTSAVISVAGVDQVVINNAGDVAATTFTGALVGNAATATALSTATGVAPVYGARAWVNFDGTKDTTGAVSTANTNRLIRGSGNVSSVLRNGTGDYTVNFTASLIDANYAFVFGAQTDSFFDFRPIAALGDILTASAIQVKNPASTGVGTYKDAFVFCVAVFR